MKLLICLFTMFSTFNTIVESTITPNSQKALISYLQEEITYPQNARENGIEGIVKIKIKITDNGQVQVLELVEALGFGCDEEATRVVENLPTKITSRLARQTGSDAVILPIQFKLNW